MLTFVTALDDIRCENKQQLPEIYSICFIYWHSFDFMVWQSQYMVYFLCNSINTKAHIRHRIHVEPNLLFCKKSQTYFSMHSQRLIIMTTKKFSGSGIIERNLYEGVSNQIILLTQKQSLSIRSNMYLMKMQVFLRYCLQQFTCTERFRYNQYLSLTYNSKW